MGRNLSIADEHTGLYFTDNVLGVEVFSANTKEQKRVATVILDCNDMENAITHFLSVLSDKKANGTYDAPNKIANAPKYALNIQVATQTTAGEAVKHDGDKPKFDLLPWEGLEAVAAVMTYGANKYGAHNWRGGLDWGRLFAACLRHMSAYWRGEDNDKESGLPHLAHAAACVLMLLTSTLVGLGRDDRKG